LVLAVEVPGPPEFLVNQESLKAEQVRAAMQVRVLDPALAARPAWAKE
jgi:hypothetical protein